MLRQEEQTTSINPNYAIDFYYISFSIYFCLDAKVAKDQGNPDNPFIRITTKKAALTRQPFYFYQINGLSESAFHTIKFG